MGDEPDGWGSVGDKYVCTKCLQDDALQAVVHANLTATECSYCHRKGRKGKLIAAEADLIVEAVHRGISREWTDPANELPYESAEGGYQGEVKDSSEVLYEVGPVTENDQLLDDLQSALGDSNWCEINYFSLSTHDRLALSWHGFEEAVKHRHRYFFLDVGQDPYDEKMTPAETLEAIARMVTEADLVRKVPKGTKFYRARVHKPADKVKTAATLGAPPPERARFSNRMSPAGISMFYGAEERATAVAETLDTSRTEPAVLTTGAFIATRDLNLLDLETTVDIPSIFDDSKGHLRHTLMFLSEFTRELSEPILKDGREHIGYVPTQIVTEFFRDRYRWAETIKADGIRYRSAQKKGGVCVVLFFDNEGCADETTPIDPKLIGLVLESKSLRHKRLNW